MRTLLSLGMVLVATLSAPAQRLVLVNPTNNAVLVPPADAFWSSNRLAILAAMSLDAEINGGAPNGEGATIHWSQLLGVPELGGGGGEGESNVIASVTADFEVLARQLSLTNATGTGAFVRASVLAPYLLSATAAGLYQPLSGALTVLAGDDGSSLTNLSGSAIASGTVPDARIAASIARLSSPALTGAPTVPTASPGTSNTVAASTEYVDRAVAAGGGGGGGGETSVPQTNTWSGFTIQTDATLGRIWRVLMTNGSQATLAVPTGASDGATLRWEFQQDGTGGRLLTLGAGWQTGSDITGITLTTNAHAVDYLLGTYNAVSNVWRPLAVSRGYR